MKRISSPFQQGFTLVELAIVLMIIGLLIGGILRGQELMENARVSATVSQVQAYSGAVKTFQDTYGMLPGDLPTALNRIPNCNAANRCTNGDGNGIIGTATGWGWEDVSGPAVPQVETTQFWKQLAMAHLITGVSLGGNPATPDWGQTHPTAKIGGGFHVLFWRGTFNTGRDGIWVRLQSPVTGTVNLPAGQHPVSPAIASRIDRKMDDGRPQTGDVNGEGPNCGLNFSAALQGTYTESSEERNCSMWFSIH